MKTDDIPRQDVKPLGQLRRDFESLEAMAESLRRLSGFESVNKSTILRWIQLEERHPNEPPTDTRSKTALDRARKAAEFLGRNKSSLRVAYHESFLYLPVMLAQMPLQGPEEGTAISSVIERHGVVLEPHIVPTGKEGLKRLLDGEVEVAFCYRYLPEESDRENGCARLTSYCRYELDGVSTINYTPDTKLDTKTLRTLRYGYPSDSGVPQFLGRHIGVLNHTPTGFADAQEAANLLLNNDVNVIIWWEPQLDLVRQILKKHHKLPTGTFPQIPIDIFVNIRAVHHKHREVISLLYCLHRICDEDGLNAIIDKADKGELAKLCQKLQAGEATGDIENILKRSVYSYDFVLDQIDLKTLFHFWHDQIT